MKILVITDLILKLEVMECICMGFFVNFDIYCNLCDRIQQRYGERRCGRHIWEFQEVARGADPGKSRWESDLWSNSGSGWRTSIVQGRGREVGDRRVHVSRILICFISFLWTQRLLFISIYQNETLSFLLNFRPHDFFFKISFHKIIW